MPVQCKHTGLNDLWGPYKAVSEADQHVQAWVMERLIRTQNGARFQVHHKSGYEIRQKRTFAIKCFSNVIPCMHV